VPFSFRAAGDTVSDALAAAGIALHDADVVAPPHESPLVPGMQITVLRARPIHILGPDLALEARTRAATVGELLAERGVSLGPLDRVEPAAEAPLPVQGAVRIVRGREDEQRELRTVPYQTRVQYSTDLQPGARQRLRGGIAGLVERLVRVVYENEAEVRRDPIQERILRPAVDEIVIAARNVLPQVPLLPIPVLPAPAIAGTPDVPVRRVVNMVATAYDPGPISTGKSPGHPAYGITATGMRAAYGVVAVDPRVIPFYTRLYVPGYGYAVAADTGGDIIGNRIDVFFPTYNEAIQWGRRTVPVYILE
jgi:3D (Asp-Asp-Asp) domain-containing protein